jgi:hypothetical protein
VERRGMLTVGEGLVYLVEQDEDGWTLVGLDAESGAAYWSITGSSRPSGVEVPVLTDGTVSFNVVHGGLLGSAPTADDDPFAIVANALRVGPETIVRALDAQTRYERWHVARLWGGRTYSRSTKGRSCCLTKRCSTCDSRRSRPTNADLVPRCYLRSRQSDSIGRGKPTYESVMWMMPGWKFHRLISSASRLRRC